MPRQHNGGLRKVCSCLRRQWSKCRHGWYFNFKPPGGPSYRFSLDRHIGRHLDSKSEAEREAEKIRIEIRDGRFGRPTPTNEMTLRQLADVYLERYVRVEHADPQEYVYKFNAICQTQLPHPTGGLYPFGDWPVTDIATDIILRFREVRVAARAGRVGVNRHVRALREVFNWGLRVGYVESTPFTRHGVSVIKFWKEPGRSRRFNADTEEESRLLAICGPHLRAVVEAALETAMRKSEILSLTWPQIEGLQVRGSSVTWASRAEIVLPWPKTKTRRARRIPISSRLKGILELRRYDPAGHPLPDTAYVFGTSLGGRVWDISRAWNTAVLKSHGHTPAYTTTRNLTATSRTVLADIDLNLHDLRREAASRWAEGGVPLHVIRDWVGHTSIAQTSAYLGATLTIQHDAMAAFEARREDLQQIATKSRTRGRKRPSTAVQGNKKTKKTGVDRQATIM